MHVILVSIMPPPGQPGRLMEGKGTGWNNVFLPRATSKPGKSPMSGEKKQLGLLMIEGITRSVRCLPRLAEGRAESRITRQLALGEKMGYKIVG